MNITGLSFNIRLGKREEAKNFFKYYKELGLPNNILGKSFFINDINYIFIGIDKKIKVGLELLNRLTNNNYDIKTIEYSAVLLNNKVEKIIFSRKLIEELYYININEFKKML